MANTEQDKVQVFADAYARFTNGKIGAEQFFNIAWNSATAASAEAATPVIAKPLRWQDKGKHHIYGTEGNEFAEFGLLEHSVGSAGFEVYQNNDGWQATFWHGNRGHSIGIHATKEEAKAAAQSHADSLVTSVAAPQARQPIGQPASWMEVASNHEGRYRIEHKSFGCFEVKCGNGDRILYATKFGKRDAELVAVELTTAFHDGIQAALIHFGTGIQPSGQPVSGAVTDDFNGDNASLCESIDALLDLDAEGALVPHGVGGHARGLLAAAANRLRLLSAHQAPSEKAVRDAASKIVARLPDGSTAINVYEAFENGRKAALKATPLDHRALHQNHADWVPRWYGSQPDK